MAEAPKRPLRPSSQRMAAPAGLRKPMGPPKPKAAPAPQSSDDDSEPLLGDDDVPMRNGPRNIADDVEEAPPPPRPSARMAAPAPAPKPASSQSARAAAPAPAAKAPPKAPAKPAPPPVEEDEDLDDDIDFEDGEVDVTAATREMPAAKPGKKLPAKGSGRADPAKVRTLTAKKSAPTADDEEEEQEEAPPSRTSKRSARSTATSARTSGKGGAKKGISKLHLIGGSVVVLLLLVVIVGYKPFMKMQYTKAVVEGQSIDERKAGADKLIDNFPQPAFSLFSEHMASGNAPLRETAIYGMGVIGKTDATRRSDAIEKLADGLKSADAPAKKHTLKAFGGIVEKVSGGLGGSSDGEATLEQKQAATLASVLLPATEPTSDFDLDLRRETIGLLAKLRTPGVCKQMVKLASTDAAVKDVARGAIAPTALPDAAGDLLRAMTSEDKALASSAKSAFVAIRDSAPSKDILPLVGDPSVDVRREIVEALGKRKGDSIAAQGITKALRDSDPSIRLLAVNAVPTTGISGPMSQLGDLSKDASPEVRIASGEMLGKLRDGDSYTVLLDSFKNNLEGKTLDAYVKSLGARARGKDMKNIGMAIGLLDSSPGSEGSIREALVLLSNNGVGPSRDKIRRAWSTEQWKQWYAKFNERERLRGEANAMVKEAQSNRNADRGTFVKWKGVVEKAMEMYEKAQAMCQPDDAEDSKSFDNELKQASVAKEYFIKGASFDLR